MNHSDVEHLQAQKNIETINIRMISSISFYYGFFFSHLIASNKTFHMHLMVLISEKEEIK